VPTTLGRVSADPADPAEPVESVDPLPAVDQAAFRRAAGRFTTGICVVATNDAGIDHAMTVSAFTSVSLDPILVLICVEKITRFHHAVLRRGRWTVSVLAEDAEEMSRWFAEKGRPTGRQLADYGRHPGTVTGMPVLDDAIAVLECTTRAVYDGGDHDILLGDVVGVWIAPAHSPSADSPNSQAPQPLLYFEGQYRQLR
jgi:flavin reductase (DIM6/NTAB) family NADH-FMN oxidoreductase RutF